ncbi:site-specific DNA-methyltransferase [Pseudoroseicyclus aestuarii]|uniref:site-specific DNA-methyltransferase (adenine-specific) n=1 Tax=Pseudoroseicyclus aestuarii TaxID=1795041 RepID=A0A318SN82_9RHOB|nr:site-specific DNA-methyltransferase [Pseudoroseicyclus aestuarii]PYE81322.1 adenine-specific DNA-methyltransferase [Pseudoroseicyclus aestuarii]
MTDRPKLEQIEHETPDQRGELLKRLKASVPEAFSDGKLDIEALQVLLGDKLADGPERFTFTWAGKRDAMAMLQAPSSATLAPDPDNSTNFDDAQHVFIEGENLEVLKVLYRSYFGRVKLIYIDPPYNTGNDFIYPDNFADPLDHYLKLTGQRTEDGDDTTSKTETAGRLHSGWLSMMYPRLSLARQFLADEGVIMMSINDKEQPNLRRLADEVFGEENFIAQLVWEKGRKNDAKLFSVGHEYIIVYGKSLAALKEAGTVWREEKPGAREIWDKYVELRAGYGEDDKTISDALHEWFGGLPKGHPSKKWARYKNVDKHGPWRDDNISWPGGDGPTYDVIHDKTGKPCAVPERGWVYSKPETMKLRIKQGIVEFREDHTEPPIRKSHLRPIADEFDEEEALDLDEEAGDDDVELATQVRGTYFYKQSQVAVRALRDLMQIPAGGKKRGYAKVFDNPKDSVELARLFKYVCNGTEQPLVMDFFGGSGSSAEAVLSLTADTNPDMRFITVQLPEPCDPKDKTGKAALAAGFGTIADVARARITKVIENMGGDGLGLRVFKLSGTSLKRWTGVGAKDPDAYAAQLEAFTDSLAPGWQTQDVIWEVALREGYSLIAKIEELDVGTGPTFWRVSDEDRSFTICLVEALTLDAVIPLGLTKNDMFVCRDTALDDTLAANLALQCRLKVI